MEQRAKGPQAREDGLVVVEVAGETLVYDRERHRAHCLNPTATLVWRRADGERSLADLATALREELNVPADEELVRHALERLENAHLLREGAPAPAATCSRRELAKRLGLVGGLSVLMPMVQSVVAPTPAMAATCVGAGQCGGQPNGTPCDPLTGCVKGCLFGICSTCKPKNASCVTHAQCCSGDCTSASNKCK